MSNNVQKIEIQIVETLAQELTWLTPWGFQLEIVSQPTGVFRH